MGGNTFSTGGFGDDAQTVFTALTEQSRHEHGNSYNGGIGDKREFVDCGEVPTVAEAVALADHLIDIDDKRIADKYGPAGCIRVAKPTKDGKKVFVFFGWASA